MLVGEWVCVARDALSNCVRATNLMVIDVYLVEKKEENPACGNAGQKWGCLECSNANPSLAPLLLGSLVFV